MNHQRFMFLFLAATTIGSIGELLASSPAAKVLDLITAAQGRDSRPRALPRPHTASVESFIPKLRENNAPTIREATQQLSALRTRPQNRQDVLRIISDIAFPFMAEGPVWAQEFMHINARLEDEEQAEFLEFILAASKASQEERERMIYIITNAIRTHATRMPEYHRGAAAAVGAGPQFDHPGAQRTLQEDDQELIPKMQASGDALQRAPQDSRTPKQAPLISESAKNGFIAQFEPLLTHQQASSLTALLQDLYNKNIINELMLRNYLTENGDRLSLGLHDFIPTILDRTYSEKFTAFSEYVLNLCKMESPQARQELLNIRDRIASKHPMADAIQAKAHRSAFIQQRDDFAERSSASPEIAEPGYMKLLNPDEFSLLCDFLGYVKKHHVGGETLSAYIKKIPETLPFKSWLDTFNRKLDQHNADAFVSFLHEINRMNEEDFKDKKIWLKRINDINAGKR